jgi:hypothetical protein
MKCGLEHGMFFSINTYNSSSEEIKKRNDNVVATKITFMQKVTSNIHLLLPKRPTMQ